MAESLNETLQKHLEQIVDGLQAAAAWLYVQDRFEDRPPQLAAGVNLPAAMTTESELGQQWQACLARWLAGELPTGEVMGIPDLQGDAAAMAQGVGYHVTLAVGNGRFPIGLLNIAYAQPPTLSPLEKQYLQTVATMLGDFLAMAQQQEEAQQNATNTAFVLLLTHTLNQKRSPSDMVATIVEQSVQILNGTGGVLWLLGQNGQWLEPIASLSAPPMAHYQPRPRPHDQGLIGQVILRGRPFCAVVESTHEQFDPDWDSLAQMEPYALLVVPLLHQQIVIGALALYRPPDNPFTNQEQALLQAAASIASVSLSSARMLQELRDYGDQQRILYEMSRQIAKGLELDTTLCRALGWMARLCSIEMSFLWLREGDRVSPAAALGFTLQPEHQTAVLLSEAGLVGWSIRQQQPAHTSDPTQDARCQQRTATHFDVPVRNILSIPMTYHDEIIGAIALVNKIGEPFNNADLTLLPMAAEMIAIAIGNARLHNQTLSLMGERERLHQQAIQQERLAVIGRLTASLSHEINNPMQAIRGALKLATEEMDDPQALADYIQLSLEQSGRVVQLIERLRSVYRPQTDKPEQLHVNRLLQNILLVTRKEMSRNRVEVQADFAPELPLVQTVGGQLQLVVLNLLLNLGDTVGAEGGGVVELRSYQPTAAVVAVSLTADLSDVAAERWLSAPAASSPQQVTFDLLFSRQVIQALGGAVRLERPFNRFVVIVELPVMAHVV